VLGEAACFRTHSFRSSVLRRLEILAARCETQTRLLGPGLGPLSRRRSRLLVALCCLGCRRSLARAPQQQLASSWGSGDVAARPVWSLRQVWQGAGGPIVLCWRPSVLLRAPSGARCAGGCGILGRQGGSSQVILVALPPRSMIAAALRPGSRGPSCRKAAAAQRRAPDRSPCCCFRPVFSCAGWWAMRCMAYPGALCRRPGVRSVYDRKVAPQRCNRRPCRILTRL